MWGGGLPLALFAILFSLSKYIENEIERNASWPTHLYAARAAMMTMATLRCVAFGNQKILCKNPLESGPKEGYTNTSSDRGPIGCSHIYIMPH